MRLLYHFLLLQVTRDVSLLSRWMAIDLYIREVDSLRFELSMNQCSDTLSRLADEILEQGLPPSYSEALIEYCNDWFLFYLLSNMEFFCRTHGWFHTISLATYFSFQSSSGFCSLGHFLGICVKFGKPKFIIAVCE